MLISHGAPGARNSLQPKFVTFNYYKQSSFIA